MDLERVRLLAGAMRIQAATMRLKNEQLLHDCRARWRTRTGNPPNESEEELRIRLATYRRTLHQAAGRADQAPIEIRIREIEERLGSD